MTSPAVGPRGTRRLVLADGSTVRGVVVFHTGTVGYVEALTDP